MLTYRCRGCVVFALIFSACFYGNNLDAGQAPGTGAGLYGQYFNTPDLSSSTAPFDVPVLARIDPVIDFNWSNNSPDPLVNGTNFSVRWTGQIQPQFTEAYTFYLTTDDGARLWIDGQLVIDAWIDQPATTYTATVSVKAGQKIPIKLEYYQRYGQAVARLEWQSPSQTREDVPATQLYGDTGIAVTIPATSAISPAFIEGLSWSLDGNPYKIKVNGTVATTTSDTGWFANVVLTADAKPTRVTARQTSTGAAINGAISWTPTDLTNKDMSSDSIVIRKGDALLLTASQNALPAVQIDPDGNGFIFKGVAGDLFPFTYNTPGVYTARAVINDGSNKQLGSLLITVVDTNLAHAPIADFVGFTREKDVVIAPESAEQSLVFTSGDISTLAVALKGPMTSPDGNGDTITLKSQKRGAGFVLARIGSATGPVVSVSAVDEFTIDLPALHDALITTDGVAGETALTVHPFVPNVRFSMDMFAHSTTFAGGVTNLSVNTSDVNPQTGKPLFSQIFDPVTNETLGVYIVSLEVPTTESMYCFRIQAHQSASREVDVSTASNVNGMVCRVYSYNTLTYMISTSTDANEPPEVWGERTVTLVSGEKDVMNDTYQVALKNRNAKIDGGDQAEGNKPISARFPPNKSTSDCKPCDNMCEPVTPDVLTGIQYGIYDKRLQNCANTNTGGNSGILAVARLETNGKAGADDFPPYACMLPKRSGVLYDAPNTRVIGEPVIVVKTGGEKVITAAPPARDQGTSAISFYGVVCNNTNKWEFEAREDGFDAALFTRKWFKNGTEFGGGAKAPPVETFDVGRWVVALEYRDKTTNEVVARAELHSLVVEAKHSDNVAGKPADLSDKYGAPFQLKGKCDPTIDLDVSIFADKAPSGARGRISLDGYPQNEYWATAADNLDIPQVLSVKHNRPVVLYAQGYAQPSTTFADKMKLRVEGQSLIEVCDKQLCGAAEETFQGTPVKWYWEHADTENYAGVEVKMNYATKATEVDGGAIVPGDYPANVNKIQNPAVVVIETAASAAANKFAKILVTTTPDIGDDGEQLNWTINSEGGNAAFFMNDNTGKRARVYGTSAGKVRLDATLKFDAGPCLQYRCLAGNVQVYPFRCNFFTDTAGATTTVTPDIADNLVKYANIIGRQAGIQLDADTNATTFTRGDAGVAVAKVMNAGVWRTGFWNVTGLDPKYVAVTTAPPTYREAAEYNTRDGVVSFNFAKTYTGARAAAIYWPANAYCKPGAPTDVFIDERDEANIKRHMGVINAPSDWGGTFKNKKYVSLICTDALSSNDLTAGTTMNHEVGHAFGLDHRVMPPDPYPDRIVSSGLIPPTTANNDFVDLMNPGPNASRLDFDLPQVVVIRATSLGAGGVNGANLKIAPQSPTIRVTKGRTQDNFRFTVTRNGNPVANASVDFTVQGGATSAVTITSARTVTTNAQGVALVSFKAIGAVGSTSTIVAIAREGSDSASGSVDITVDPFTINANNVTVNVGATKTSNLLSVRDNNGSGIQGVAISIGGFDATVATVNPATGTTSGGGYFSFNVTGLKVGSTVATVTATFEAGTQTKNFTITVNNDFTITANPVTVNAGQTKTSNLISVRDSTGSGISGATIAIAGFDNTIATINPANGSTSGGGFFSFAVTGVKVGTTTATVTATVGGNPKTKDFTITVNNDFTITANPVTVNVGATKASNLISVRDSGGSGISGATIAIAGFDNTIATINPVNGSISGGGFFSFSVTGVKIGTTTATVTATVGGNAKTKDFTITVNNDFTITASPVTLRAGATSGTNLISVRDSSGSGISGATVAIAGFDNTIATVNPVNGATSGGGFFSFAATGVKAGTTTATVSVTLGGMTKTKDFTITVQP